jgi:hypothetical protein
MATLNHHASGAERELPVDLFGFIPTSRKQGRSNEFRADVGFG